MEEMERVSEAEWICVVVEGVEAVMGATEVVTRGGVEVERGIWRGMGVIGGAEGVIWVGRYGGC